MGYGSRKTESEGIASRLKVRALAIGGDDAAEGGPAVLVAVDNCARRGEGDRRSGDAAEDESRTEARAVRRLLDAHPLRAGPEQRARLHLRHADTRPTRKRGSSATPAS